jgi:ABC-type transporter Mla subunit MlaD
MSPATRTNRRAKRPSALANPVLVGAMTVLVVMVAVFLAYNANNGLPFVPTRELKVDVASGSDLVPGNEVREGGFLVGVVQSMKPITLPSGQVAGQLTLQLTQSYGKVPVDSTAEIRPLSVLGLKYVDLHVGGSRTVFQDGATLPIKQTSVPVQFEDIFQMFDAKTRRAVDQNLVGFGDTLAGRGSALNDTIASLPALLGYLRPVTQYLAAPNTELTRLLRRWRRPTRVCSRTWRRRSRRSPRARAIWSRRLLGPRRPSRSAPSR